ncbi:MAG TPA: hypothetical protein VMI30_10395 [Stellaceae bacterium]|nr:hypothetical protein [Stellaceae bacterium]
MRLLPPLGDRWRAVFRRLDQVAAWVNPVLMIIAAYLLILNLSGLAALEISRLPRLVTERLAKQHATIAASPSSGPGEATAH